MVIVSSDVVPPQRINPVWRNSSPHAQTVVLSERPLYRVFTQTHYITPLEGMICLNLVAAKRERPLSLLLSPDMMYPVVAGRTVTLYTYNEQPRSVSLICEPCIRRMMQGSAAQRTPIHRAILAANRMLNDEIELYMQANTRQRIASKLLRLAADVADDAIVITQVMLADMLNVQRESVSLAMGELRNANLIKTNYGRIRIVDRVGLRAFATAW